MSSTQSVNYVKFIIEKANGKMQENWVMECVMMCLMVSDVVCNVVYDNVDGYEGGGKVKWLILCCLGFCFMTDGWTDIGGCRVAFATEKL